ncbi:nuclear transport factor 2 family protein [Actinorhabdospora filicis]|uniref:nuclear transport factor 2 family protein n=1 Tax=Actinorhabdospora filicis TaxID=1785913 RepID=UPI002556DBC6|nr:nuclear transport factor 2 family protein [Actinorhabdospora filicis]
MTHSGAVTPREIYRRMRESVLAEDATLLPAELLAEDLVVETPFSPPGMRRYEGREAWLRFFAERALPVRFHEIRDIAVHDTADPGVIVVEYELSGTVTTTGVTASATFVGVLGVRDGLIRLWREYQDVRAIAEALAA